MSDKEMNRSSLRITARIASKRWSVGWLLDWITDYRSQCKFHDESDFQSHRHSISARSTICFSIWHSNRETVWAAYSCCSHCWIHLEIMDSMIFKIPKIVPFDLNFPCANNQIYPRDTSRLDVFWFRVYRNLISAWYIIAGMSRNCTKLVDISLLNPKWSDRKDCVTQNMADSEIQKSCKINCFCKALISSFMFRAGRGKRF
jgi:hypothetical protein